MKAYSPATANNSPPSTALRRETPKSYAWWAVLAAIVLLSTAILIGDISRGTVGVLSLLLCISLMVAGVHIAVSLITGSIAGLYTLGGWNVLVASFNELPYETVASWQYSVIPMFILMGMILWRSGISGRAFEAARQWFGWMPGGLAVGTTAAGGGLAAASGSTIGIAYALGRVSIPEMLGANYRPSLAIGTVSMAGVVGQIIPPSIILVIYAGIAQTPVGPQLLAGIVPGVLMLFAFAALIVVRSSVDKTLAPPVSRDDVNWRSKLLSLYGVVPILIVILVVIGGLSSGLFTATEAGAAGALIALVLGFFALPRESGGTRNWRGFFSSSFLATVSSTASIMLLLVGVYFLTRLLTVSRLANELASWLSSLELAQWQFLLILIPFYLLLGMFLDTLAVMLITVPVLLPTLIELDVNLLWFGVFVVILAELALATPPLGILIFVVYRIYEDAVGRRDETISLLSAFWGVLPFVVVTVGVLVFLMIVPELATWLPDVS